MLIFWVINSCYDRSSYLALPEFWLTLFTATPTFCTSHNCQHCLRCEFLFQSAYQMRHLPRQENATGKLLSWLVTMLSLCMVLVTLRVSQLQCNPPYIKERVQWRVTLGKCIAQKFHACITNNSFLLQVWSLHLRPTQYVESKKHYNETNIYLESLLVYIYNTI